jgi:hypothetical protein
VYIYNFDLLKPPLDHKHMMTSQYRTGCRLGCYMLIYETLNLVNKMSLIFISDNRRGFAYLVHLFCPQPNRNTQNLSCPSKTPENSSTITYWLLKVQNSTCKKQRVAVWTSLYMSGLSVICTFVSQYCTAISHCGLIVILYYLVLSVGIFFMWNFVDRKNPHTQLQRNMAIHMQV